MQELIDQAGDVELFIISAGTGYDNPKLRWNLEAETIATNVRGFSLMANLAVKHLNK